MLAYVASVTSRDIEASDSMYIEVVLMRPPSETDEASGGIEVVLMRPPFETDEAPGGIEVVLIVPPSSVFDGLVQVVSEND